MKYWAFSIAFPVILQLATTLSTWADSITLEKDSDPASLSRLHDIVSPPPISWWPLAPGWYILAAILILLVVWVSVRAFRHYAANRYRRKAFAELQRLQPLVRQSGGLSVATGQVMELLKRTAFVSYPREQIASLNGDAWWKFLDQSIGSSMFAQNVGPILERLTYGKPFETDTHRAEVDAAFRAVGTWIKNHHPIGKRMP